MLLSACLIVRDEATFLPACLASLAGVADEIIVVDTGSRDATVAIAAAAGAKVSHFTWCDDFAAARNASLAEANGDFVLIIDADERFAPGAGASLRARLASATFDCGMVRFHTAVAASSTIDDVLSGAARDGEINHLPRVLRNVGGLRFEGRIHENVLAWILKRGRRIETLPVDMVHFGGAADVRALRNKAERNVKLLGELTRERPQDPTPFGYLAYELLELGRREEARTAIAAGWRALEANGAGAASVLRLATARARVMLEDREEEQAIVSVDKARAVDGDHPDLDFFEGAAFEMLALRVEDRASREAHLTRAIYAYASARARETEAFAQAFVRGATTWSSATRLGVVQLLSNRLDAAERAFKIALSYRSDHLEARLGLAEVFLERGEAARAIALLEQLVGDSPDAWLLAAAAADKIGSLHDCLAFLDRARRAATNGYLSPHRRLRHIALHLAAGAQLDAMRAKANATITTEAT